MVSALRPGSTPPTRKLIGSTLLDETFEDIIEDTKQSLHGKKVTLIQDGWSDVHNEPVIACQMDERRFFFPPLVVVPIKKQRNTASSSQNAM